LVDRRVLVDGVNLAAELLRGELFDGLECVQCGGPECET
jgi:hypothetical protein